MTKRLLRRPIPADHQLPPTLHPVLQRVFASRGVKSEMELDYRLQRLHPYTLLSGIEQAVDLLVKALKRQECILIVADFDADGATSCALAVRGLRAMGAEKLYYVVPNRFKYGYGLTREIVEVAAKYKPDLLITVDNGTSSIEGVEEAKRRGMRVLITDHHLPGAELPPADAIVNPNQPGDLFPSKHLAGVGVMFYVLMALRARLRTQGWFNPQRSEPNLAEFLDLVALGTIADVATLDYNNRILVAQGLARLRAGHCQPGIRAIIKRSGRDLSRLTASDLGFAVGPRLNAAGRLTDMSLGIECLLCEDEGTAEQMASRLEALNEERRALERTMQAQAMRILEQSGQVGDSRALPYGLCLFDESWHQGIIGILAARIRERIHRPVIVFATSSEDQLKGSARSVTGVHIRDVLDTIAATHPGLITKFGGHAMAAGLELRRGSLEAFKTAFNQEVQRRIPPEGLGGVIYTDGALSARELCVSLAQQLRSAGPWGQGFPEPVFDGEFEVVARHVVADKHLKLVLRLPADRHNPTSPGPEAGDPSVVEAIALNTLDNFPDIPKRVTIAYRLEANEYQGMKNLQLILEHIIPR